MKSFFGAKSKPASKVVEAATDESVVEGFVDIADEINNNPSLKTLKEQISLKQGHRSR
ncbi:MAG UNVERIFIED_CONTAM: hypothetical protein LVQ98_05305 [Rickettsiaceae bacterium]